MLKNHIKRIIVLSAVLVFFVTADLFAGGVSPYLPLNMSPEIERQIERLLILAERPVMTRPIAVATVLDALHDAREKDEELCEQVKMYLIRYLHDVGIPYLNAEVSVSTGDSDHVIPNQHGKYVSSSWEVSGDLYYRLGSFVLFNLGGIAYEGDATPTGSMLSMGIDYAQLDIGYRDHWLSPFTDSSMLVSTEAPTMPSITLSNYRPISRLGISYQIFLADMSESSRIAYKGRYTKGNPRLAGVHLQAEPLTGYSFSFNRQFQFGGGERPNDSLGDLIDAFVDYSEHDTIESPFDRDREFGNQEASLTSRIIFPGKRPFSVYFEYAGEDSSHFGTYRLGCVSFSMGLDMPLLWDVFDLSYETTEWQNGWYVHHIYQDGVTNKGLVVGHWFGDQRRFNDDAGGGSHMLRLGWQLQSGDYMRASYRTLKNGSYTTVDYERMHELALGYSHQWNGQIISLELASGRDVSGEFYTRLSASMDFMQDWMTVSAGSCYTEDEKNDVTDLFVDMGMSYNKFHTNLRYTQDGNYRRRTAEGGNAHFGFGARRSVTDRSDLGTRIEYDRVAGHDLLSFRMLDYRYSMGDHFALSGFFGVGRYSLDTPAYGYYFGFGPQFPDIFPKWDLCIDASRRQDMARRKSKAGAPPPDNLQYDVRGVAVYLSRYF